MRGAVDFQMDGGPHGSVRLVGDMGIDNCKRRTPGQY